MDFPHSASVEAAVIVPFKEASGLKSEKLVGGVWWHVMYSRNLLSTRSMLKQKKTLMFYGQYYKQIDSVAMFGVVPW